MHIQIQTDNHIEGYEALATWASGELTTALSHHKDQITRVEMHVGDKNALKGGPGSKRCMLEARLQGRQPVAVTHHADTLYQAVTGAAEKLNRVIDGALGRAARAESAPG